MYQEVGIIAVWSPSMSKAECVLEGNREGRVVQRMHAKVPGWLEVRPDKSKAKHNKSSIANTSAKKTEKV